MVIRGLVLAIVGSALATCVGLVTANNAGRPPAVSVAPACSPATREWAEGWRSPGTRAAEIGSLVVICRSDGTPYVAVVRSPVIGGQEIGSWRAAPTFFQALPAAGSERIDVFDTGGRLRRYAMVDRRTQRIEFFDAESNFAGLGTYDPASGAVDRIGADGRRRTPTALLIPPLPDGADLAVP